MAEAPRTAVALAYDVGDLAPRVVAKGHRETAEAILKAAREAGVPVREDDGLAKLLMAVPLDDHIPPALYVAVAEVLAWLHRTERLRGLA